MGNSYDFIIVGAGSAGCVLADRLSACGNYTVLVLEAGGTDLRPFVQIPMGYGKTYYQRAVNWMYHTEPEPGLKGQRSYWPRGRVLGGSSSINAMVYIRGHRQDFDDWAAAGNPGWSYEQVLPYFKKSEANAQGEAAYHGREGPLHIDDQRAQLHPLTQKFIDAGVESGIAFNPDFNGAEQAGIGAYQSTVHRGRRMSTARAFLRPAMKRANVTVITGALATRIVFEEKRAVAVEFKRRGQLQRVQIERELILSAGAINSPQLLQLSGVGPLDVLQAAGVEQVHDSPAVGRHLQDHLGVDFIFKSKHKSLNDELHPWWGKLWAGVKYFCTGGGPLSLSLNQGGGFVKTDAALKQPNLQLYFSPVSYTRAPAGTRPLMNPDPFSAFMLGVSNCRPKSRGRIAISSADPSVAPRIQANYLAEDADVQELLAGIKLIRRMAQSPTFKELISEEQLPGQACQSDEQMIDYLRETAWTVFHPCCSCRMGVDPATHVVDARLRVHGLQRLRVVDASVFAEIVSGNTNAPVIMVAEKAADMILEDARSL